VELRGTIVKLIDNGALAAGVYGSGSYGSGSYGAPSESASIPGMSLTVLPLDETASSLP
jgi:hypothetical protein